MTAALLAGLLSLAMGCAGAPYYDTQREWTRRHEAYGVFETQAYVRATLKSEPFRRAYVRHYTNLFALTQDQAAALLELELDEHAQSHVVVCAFYTPDVGANDLNPNRGFWEVRLEGPRGDYVHPHQVTRLKQRDPTFAAMYPYVSQQFTLYELRFDRQTIEGRELAKVGERIDLVIAGAPARIRMGWTLQ